MFRLWSVAFWMLSLAGLAPPALARAGTPCEQLKSIVLPRAEVTAAAMVATRGRTVCRVEATSRPTPDSDIRIEVWLPAGDAWNGRYIQIGNGGFAGSIFSPELESLAAQGFAAAGTDDGHRGQSFDGRWALGHHEKVVDYGWRALKVTTDTAKDLIGAYEGEGPKYAYFDGCSDGGREALMEAQRFPDDFNGIVAGAPANYSTRLISLFAFDVQTLARPGAYLTPDKVALLESAALRQCAQGGAYIVDPQSCRFDPKTLVCAAGADTAKCLTKAQAASAAALYRGLVSAKGALIYPGVTPGGETGPYRVGGPSGGKSWELFLTGPSQAAASTAAVRLFADGYFRNFVFQDPNFDLLKLDLAAAPRLSAGLARDLDSANPDLSRFRAHGGKLIQYHGWNDSLIPARGSIVYYEDVRRAMGPVGDFYRLYMIPGMDHCAGGRGPSSVDWLGLVRGWVERGEAPEAVTAQVSAAGYAEPASPPVPGAPSQLLCPYPEHPSAVGSRCVVRRLP